MPVGSWYSRRLATTLAVLMAVACMASAATTADASPTVSPGPTTSPVTLTTGYTLSGYDVATSTSGTAYIGWIANTSKSNGATRAVHLCEVKPGTTSCSGGVQVVDALGDSSAEGLRVLVHSSGKVALVWFYEDVSGGHIGLASTSSTGTLQPAIDVGGAPKDGQLLDAEIAPDDSVWTVAGPSSGNGIQVRPGGGTAAKNVSTPYSVGFAELAFTGTTPVIATQEAGSITQPAGYTYESRGSWSAVHNVAQTWTGGARVGLAETRYGLRLIASVDNSSYQPVVAAWTGAGFSKPTETGDHNPCGPRSHDTVADASGRLADISYECTDIAVTNLPDTRHAAVVRFSAGGTINATDPRLATTPRGHAFAVWSVAAGASDRLLLVPVLLPDLSTTTTEDSSAGSVSVTGPVSCLPADDIGVGVEGKPAKNWHVHQQWLTLGAETVHSPLAGASLTAGKTYTLTGHVTFTDGNANKSVTAAHTFRACPAP
ncbi:MAG: hypothetical protein ABSD78_14830 [Acidimicrobiales bacterium]